MKLPITVAHSRCLLIHPNSFHRGMLKLNAKLDADCLLCWLSHFESDGHTVHMLIQQRLPPPPTSTVKSSLFMHEHSSPLSLPVRLHSCCANHSCCVNHRWTFSGQTSYDAGACFREHISLHCPFSWAAAGVSTHRAPHCAAVLKHAFLGRILPGEGAWQRDIEIS